MESSLQKSLLKQMALMVNPWLGEEAPLQLSMNFYKHIFDDDTAKGYYMKTCLVASEMYIRTHVIEELNANLNQYRCC